jgi:hypothetical protein
MKGVPRSRPTAKFKTAIKVRQRVASGLIVALDVSDEARQFIGQKTAHGGAPLGGEYARLAKQILLDRNGDILPHGEGRSLNVT